MPPRIWWIATALVSFIFVISLLTEITGLTAYCRNSPALSVCLLAIPTVATGSCAIVASYHERAFRTAKVRSILQANTPKRLLMAG